MAHRKKVSRYRPVALLQEWPAKGAWISSGQDPWGASEVRTERARGFWRPLARGPTCPEAFLIGNALQ